MLPETERLAENLKAEHNVPVIPMNVDTMNEKDIYMILKEALYEFPILEVKVNMPEWIAILSPNNEVKKSYIASIRESVCEVDKLKDIENITKGFLNNDNISKAYLSDVDPSTGIVTIKQGGRYGIKLKAVAPSIHMIRVDVNSTFEPIIGSEVQSKELIDYLMKDYDTDPQNIWKSEIFGRSLDVIVQEGIQSKISLMPDNIRYKLSQTLTKIVNKGSNNLIAIVI